VVGKGTAFIVTIPFGTAHLPSDWIGMAQPRSATASRADAYVAEALRWLPTAEAGGAPSDRAEDAALPPVAGRVENARILVADDNADMRAYIARLLGARWQVEAVADGQAALEAIRRQRPHLVLTDVMMPKLGGFELLRAIRDDPQLRDLPAIMLSARAGEEAQVEGLDAGADDYLSKPFSARELTARVNANSAGSAPSASRRQRRIGARRRRPGSNRRATCACCWSRTTRSFACPPPGC
jgi:CheY-like chemotaxis protein